MRLDFDVGQKMKLRATFAYIALTMVCGAAEPALEKLPDMVTRFTALYPKGCENLVADVRIRLTRKNDKMLKQKIEAMDRCLDGLRSWHIPALRLCMKYPSDRLPLADALNRVSAGLSFFRKSLDAVVIDALADKAFVMDEVFLKRLHEFWDDEYYFTFHFDRESAALSGK